MLQGHQSSLQHHWRDVFVHIQLSCAAAQTWSNGIGWQSKGDKPGVTNASFSQSEQSAIQVGPCSGQGDRGGGGCLLCSIVGRLDDASRQQ